MTIKNIDLSCFTEGLAELVKARDIYEVMSNALFYQPKGINQVLIINYQTINYGR
ncbi:hypothetical protein MASR2M39_21360 [Ignavibacteriales bacterium]